MANDDVKRTCCFCFDIRKGIIFLLSIQLIFFGVAAALLGAGIGALKNTDSNDLTGAVDDKGIPISGSDLKQGLTTIVIISVVVLAVEALFALYGLFCVMKRNASGFKVFTIVTGICLIFNIVSVATTRPVAVSSIVSCVINAYFVYVYWSYIDTMKEEKGELVNSSA
ncbi:hypothetical protein BC828DRAFT_391325 [Blastocladiella britannica]|nr:hypothetical protein BC828DRAFT_391325 [Blastocladiella britannica]